MDVPRLLQLLSVLYPPPTTPPYQFPSQQQQADAQRELFDGMADPAAWGLATRVLDACGHESWAEDTNARFLAAHTLAVKTSRDWSGLPPDHHLPLKSRLMQWLATSSRRAYPPQGHREVAGERVVLRKLAVATAALSLKLVPSPPGSWPDWILEVVTSVASTPPPPPGRQAVLEILTVIAEEAARADLVGSRRVQYDQSLQDASRIITSTLSDSLDPSESPSVRSLGLRCSQVWLSSSHLTIEAPTTLWPLLLASLTDLREGLEDVVTRAADCIEELVGSSGTATGFVTRTRADALLEWFAGPQFGHLLDVAVAGQDVSDVVLSLIKLFVSLLELSVATLAASLSSPRTRTLLERLLSITSFPGYYGVDEHVSSLPLSIWTLLQEDLADSGALGDHAEVVGQLDNGLVATELFDAVATRLRIKSTWPTESDCTPENGWTSDHVKGFRMARFDVGEAMLSCYYVVRENLLRQWVDMVPQLAARQQEQGQCFEDLEAVLHCIKVVQEAVPNEEDQHLPRLFNRDQLARIPRGDRRPLLRLQTTVLGTIAAYAPWFRDRQDGLLAALDFVVPSLSSADLDSVSASANALKRLCDEGRNTLVHHIAPLAHVIRSTEGKLPPEEYQKVLQSVVSVLQALPAAEQAGPVCSLVDPIIGRLEDDLQVYSNIRATDARDRILGHLALLKACGKGLSEPDEDIVFLDGTDESSDAKTKASQLGSLPDVQSLRRRLAAVMSSVVRVGGDDADLAVAVTDVLRQSTSGDFQTAMSLDPFPILLSTVTAASAGADRGLAIWFSLATSLVVATHRTRDDGLGPDETDALVDAVRSFVGVAASILASEEAMKSEPDTMQAFLHLCVAVTHQFVQVFDILRAELETVTVIAIRALVVEERVALQAALGLLSLFIQQTRTQSAFPDLFRHLITVHGLSIFHRVVAGIGGALPRSTVSSLAEVLHSAVLRLPDQTRLWLRQLLDQPGFPSEKVSPEKKTRFVTGICAARTLKKARDVCTEFATVARGLDGSAYGATTLTLTL